MWSHCFEKCVETTGGGGGGVQSAFHGVGQVRMRIPVGSGGQAYG